MQCQLHLATSNEATREAMRLHASADRLHLHLQGAKWTPTGIRLAMGPTKHGPCPEGACLGSSGASKRRWGSRESSEAWMLSPPWMGSP